MLILLVLGAIVFVIWLVFLIRSCILQRFCPRYFEKEKAC